MWFTWYFYWKALSQTMTFMGISNIRLIFGHTLFPSIPFSKGAVGLKRAVTEQKFFQIQCVIVKNQPHALVRIDCELLEGRNLLSANLYHQHPVMYLAQRLAELGGGWGDDRWMGEWWVCGRASRRMDEQICTVWKSLHTFIIISYSSS